MVNHHSPFTIGDNHIDVMILGSFGLEQRAREFTTSERLTCAQYFWLKLFHITSHIDIHFICALKNFTMFLMNIPTLVDILSSVDITKVIEDDKALLSWLQDLSRCENM